MYCINTRLKTVLGYFDKSIQQSGTATDEWAFSYYPRKAAFDLGKKLGINSEDSAILMNSLAQLDSAEILKVSESSFQVNLFFNVKNMILLMH